MPAATASQFGIFLRKLRQRERLSQSTLASYLNVNHAIISRIETGNLKPPLDSAFYDQLRTVPGFTEADVTLLLNATEADKSTETAGELLDQLIATLDRLWNLELASSLSGQKFLRDLVSAYVDSESRFSMHGFPGYALAMKPATHVPPAPSEEEGQELSPESFTTSSVDAIISSLMPPPEVEPGDHLTSYTSEQGDPNAAQGTNAAEHGLEQPSTSTEQRRRAPKKGEVYQRTRSHYDREYMQENAEHVVGLVFEAAKSNDSDLSTAAEQVVQSIHVVAESVAKSKGSSLSKVSRELGIPLRNVSDYVVKDLIPVLYKDKGTIYLANETAEELRHDYQEAKEMGIPPVRLLRERREKYFPEASKNGT